MNLTLADPYQVPFRGSHTVFKGSATLENIYSSVSNKVLSKFTFNSDLLPALQMPLELVVVDLYKLK